MTGDCHVRFYESRGLRCPRLLTKSPAITTWRQAHPRFHMHFTPTYSSWINQVERLFGFVTPTSSNAATTAACKHRNRYPHLGEILEPEPQALHLDQDRRTDPRLTRQTYSTD
jgi:hypothetical protein